MGKLGQVQLRDFIFTKFPILVSTSLLFIALEQSTIAKLLNCLGNEFRPTNKITNGSGEIRGK